MIIANHCQSAIIHISCRIKWMYSICFDSSGHAPDTAANPKLLEYICVVIFNSIQYKCPLQSSSIESFYGFGRLQSKLTNIFFNIFIFGNLENNKNNINRICSTSSNAADVACEANGANVCEKCEGPDGCNSAVQAGPIAILIVLPVAIAKFWPF